MNSAFRNLGIGRIMSLCSSVIYAYYGQDQTYSNS
jgi:hypothetical protein